MGVGGVGRSWNPPLLKGDTLVCDLCVSLEYGKIFSTSEA